jgi:protocatechuate 3,4-dioxygenase beta subunit
MQKISNNVLCVICACALFLFCTQSAEAQQQYPGTNLKGQVLTTNLYRQQVPLPNALVELFFFDGRFPVGQQWRLIASTTTDAYGVYGFQYVFPNNYTIWVNQTKSLNISVIYIDYRLYTHQNLPVFYF